MGFVTDFNGLAICRFFLGLSESALFPGICFYLTNWYRREETVRAMLALIDTPCSPPPSPLDSAPKLLLTYFYLPLLLPRFFLLICFFVVQSFRIALFFSSATLAGAFGGQSPLICRLSKKCG